MYSEPQPTFYQTSYSEQFPFWGQPGYYNFKHKEPRILTANLPLKTETTYRKSYDIQNNGNNGSPSKSVWGNIEFM